MTSTLFGLVTGIVIAAYLTTHYSDTINRHLGRLLLSPESVAAASAPLGSQAEETVQAPLPVKPQAESEPGGATATDASGESEAPSPGQQPELRQEVPLPARDDLEQRWAEFASAADSLAPVGDFRWRQCFTRAAAAHGVPESLLLAIASGESGFEPAARSDKDAVGIMQIRWPGTSRHLGILREADLYDPCTNIDAGARYIAELTDLFANNLHRAVAAYNYGPGRIAGKTLTPGARWYSQYIYQHLQRVLGRPHVPSSELVPPRVSEDPGYQVLITFNESYRARDYKAFLQAQLPGLELAHRSELPGQHQVVLLYSDDAARRQAMDAIQASGLLATRLPGSQSISL